MSPSEHAKRAEEVLAPILKKINDGEKLNPHELLEVIYRQRLEAYNEGRAEGMKTAEEINKLALN